MRDRSRWAGEVRPSTVGAGPNRGELALKGPTLVVSHSSAVAEALVQNLKLPRAQPIGFRELAGRFDCVENRPGLAIVLESDYSRVPPVVRFLKQHWSGVRVLVVGVENQEDVILGCLASGVDGVVTCEESLEDLRHAVSEVRDNRLCAPPHLIRPLVDRLVSREVAGQPQLLARLSAREVDILTRLAQGGSNKDIANELHVEVQTVKNHVSHILRRG